VTNGQVIVVRGEKELMARAGHLLSTAKKEFVCAATDMDTWSRPAARVAMTKRMRPVIGGGLVVRKLYTSAALADDGQRMHLQDVAAVGAHVRICQAGLPHETIIIDRRVMILAGPGAPGDREFSVTTAPLVIDGVRALFDATWETAAPLGVRLSPDLPTISADGREILRTLGEGLTDEAAARRLGMSLRTYRRRVAELMRLLESDSRFQAGLRAGELGLTS
jgi:DNA-binding CsgD family transcriptional regulator